MEQSAQAVASEVPDGADGSEATGGAQRATVPFSRVLETAGRIRKCGSQGSLPQRGA